MRRLVLLPMLLWAAGCGMSVATWKIGRFEHELAAAHAASPPPAAYRVATPVVVSVPPVVGCVLTAPPNAPAAWACISLPASDDADLVARVRAFACGLPRPMGGFYVPDYGETLALLLRQHLMPLFVAASVEVGPPRGHALTPLLDGAAGRHVMVQLVTPLPSGAPLIGVGDAPVRSALVHMAWALPLMLITFPIGLVWVPPIIGAIARRNAEEAVARGSDAAAHDFAVKLNAFYAQPPPPPPPPLQ